MSEGPSWTTADGSAAGSNLPSHVQIMVNDELDGHAYHSLPIDLPSRLDPHHNNEEAAGDDSNDSSFNSFVDSDTNNEADSSMDILCMSPPQTRIQAKFRDRKSKKHRLVHSSALPGSGSEPQYDGGGAGGSESTSDLVDTLTEMQDRQNSAASNTSAASASSSKRPSVGNISIPSITTIKSDMVNNPNRAAYETIKASGDGSTHLMATSGAYSSRNRSKSPANSSSKRSSLSRQPNKKSTEIDPFEREESYKKISGLLKLALSNKPECSAPPPTPMPSSSASSLSAQVSPFFRHHSPSTARPPSSGSGGSSYSGGDSAGSLKSTSKQAMNQTDEALKKQMAESVWKHLFDYFVFYKERSVSEEQLEERLRDKRSIIPLTIDEINLTNFTSITQHMNCLIKQNMKTPADYSKLYQHRAFIDQLCYLFWLVEDILNQVGYIESLYPSIRLLKEDQPKYDENFEGTVKTLLLWYKIMHDLMSKCDVLGLFLGFGKKTESKQYWTWFDQRLKYSRSEYEVVKKWLDDSFLGSMNSTLHNEESSDDEEQMNATRDGAGGGRTNRSVSEATETVSALMPPPPRFSKHSPSRANRQVSFELRASNSSNLLYNNIETPSILDSSRSPFSSAKHNDSTAGGQASSSDPKGVDHELSSGSVNSKSTPPSAAAEGPITAQTIATYLFGGIVDAAAKKQQPAVNAMTNENDHLKPVKIHHLQSYISRSSSYISNNTDSPINNGSFSSSFYSSMHEMSLLDQQNKSKVAFGLHDDDTGAVSPPTNSSSDAANCCEPTPTALADIASSLFETQATLTNDDDDRQAKEPGSGAPPAAALESQSSMDENREKIYQEFLHKRLRKHGLTKTCDEIREVIIDALPHALQALQVDHCERHPAESLMSGAHFDQNFYYHLMPVHRKCREYMAQFPFDEETLKYGVSGEWFKRLNLPSPRPLYLYLSNVILDLMHACIRMQISSKSDMKKQSSFRFSLLSIEVLTHECRECIEQAILVRQFYSHMVYSVFVSSEMDVQGALETDMLNYDENLKQIIEIYLTFITDWIHDLVANTSSYKALEVLSEEWKFCKNNLYFVTGSEDMYAKRFCTLCSLVNDSLGHSLSDLDTKHKQPLMEYISNEETKMSDIYNNYDSLNSDAGLNTGASEDGGGELSSSQEDAGGGSAEGSFDTTQQDGELDTSHGGDSGDGGQRHHRFSFDHDAKFDINLRCNDFKEEINKLRKRSMKALEFCSSLINDLELAAKYSVTGPIQNLLNELKSTNHVLVSFINPELQMSSFNPTPNSSNSSFTATPRPASSMTTPSTPSSSTGQGLDQHESNNNNNSPSFMIFVPYEFSKDKTQIVRLLFLISAKDDMELAPQPPASASSQSSTGTESSLRNAKKFSVTENSPSSSFHKQSNKPSVVRRLSSSNSFIELSDMQRDKFLHRLSKFADLGKEKSSLDKIASGSSSPTEMPNAFIFSPLPYTDGYLLFIQLPKDFNEQIVWTGSSIKLHASMPVRRSLYQHKSISGSNANLILVVPRPSTLAERRIELKSRLKGMASLVKEKTSFHPNIENAIDELKDNILNLRDETIKCIQSIEKDLKSSVHYGVDNAIAPFQQRHTIEQRSLSEIWRVSYNFGIELQNECMKFMTQDRAELYSKGLAEFCIMWCDYIIDKTERGKGRTVRPWAAKKGLYLMNLAWQNSSVLKDEDFYRLKIKVESCLLHVIGGRKQPSGAMTAVEAPAVVCNIRPSTSMMINQEPVPTVSHQPAHRQLSHQNSLPQLSGSKENINVPSSSAAARTKARAKLPPSERFSQECSRRDKERESALLVKRYIGKILVRQRPQNLITATEVSFRWQLGLQIGQGQYGKVYSCVNLDTGEPMAMKEIPFKSNDIETIKGIADEINNVQGINHENLVKFYGAELHRKEILIFMEFCGDQSTLDRISREASGLPEKIVRDYTKSLLKAVATLHDNMIMHRDIKGANIFLKATDPKHPDRVVLKLGDFGCSIKFKDPIGASNRNIKATGFMGTFPFMAPEVMISEGAIDAGYTFVADIWSLGCVVVEMFTGKRPWHPLTDEIVMFKVHILKEQKKPPYPTSSISEEAIDFLNHCFEYEPSDRYTADQLLDHPFAKVELVDDR